MNIEELIEKIYKKYNEAKATDFIRKLSEKFSTGVGTYKDLYEYANSLGEGLGEILLEYVAPLDFEESGNFIQILKDYSDDIALNGVLVQTSRNLQDNIRIKPQIALFDSEKADGLIRNIMLTRNATKEVANFGMSIVDDTIQKNAEILRKSGYETIVVREYDNVGIHTQASSKGGHPWKRRVNGANSVKAHTIMMM